MTSQRSAIQEPCSEYWNRYFWDKHEVFRNIALFSIRSYLFVGVYDAVSDARVVWHLMRVYAHAWVN